MSGDEPVSVCTGFRRAVFPVHLATLLLFAHIYRPNTLCYCARKMSIYVGATFHSFDEFLKVFKEYCESTHQKFVVGGSKKLDTVNKQKQEHEHKKTASSSESIVYAYIQYRCIRQGFYQTASKGIRRTSYVVKRMGVMCWKVQFIRDRQNNQIFTMFWLRSTITHVYKYHTLYDARVQFSFLSLSRFRTRAYPKICKKYR